MALEQAVDSVVIAASPDSVAEAAIDVESYPVWARSVKAVRVDERDESGRPVVAGFASAALGFRIHYTLRYDYSKLPDSYSWDLVEGDLRFIDGAYDFETKDGGAHTQVTYRLRVEFGFPLPGFVIRRAEKIVMGIALRELKAYVEG